MRSAVTPVPEGTCMHRPRRDVMRRTFRATIAVMSRCLRFEVEKFAHLHVALCDLACPAKNPAHGAQAEIGAAANLRHSLTAHADRNFETGRRESVAGQPGLKAALRRRRIAAISWRLAHAALASVP